jgi:phospholipid transport system substrate-binding protein
MKHSALRAFAVIVVLLAGAIGNAAAESAPVAQVRAAIDEASPVFANQQLPPAERDKQLRTIAEKYFDFTYMAKSAMGTHWKTLSAAQRKELVPAVEDYVLATYLTTFQQNTVEAASHALKDDVKYEDPETAVVRSEVHLKMVQDPLQVAYMLHKIGGNWKLYDIVVDNVSTLGNYRDQFNKIMNKDGFDKLVAGLKSGHLPAPS